MKCTVKALLSVILLATPIAAPAQEAPLETIPVDQAPEGGGVSGAPTVPYTYASGRLHHTEDDRSAVEGMGVEGSYLLLPNVFAVGALFVGESDDASSVESTQVELGAGYRIELMPALELNAALRLLKLDVKSSTRTTEELGYQFDADVRRMLWGRIEGSGGVSFVEVDDSSHAYLTGSALYAVLPQLGVGAEATVGSNSYSYGLLGRWAF